MPPTGWVWFQPQPRSAANTVTCCTLRILPGVSPLCHSPCCHDVVGAAARRWSRREVPNSQPAGDPDPAAPPQHGCMLVRVTAAVVICLAAVGMSGCTQPTETCSVTDYAGGGT